LESLDPASSDDKILLFPSSPNPAEPFSEPTMMPRCYEHPIQHLEAKSVKNIENIAVTAMLSRRDGFGRRRNPGDIEQ
jgi:hypothetical protein